jgi:hypothetical protein
VNWLNKLASYFRRRTAERTFEPRERPDVNWLWHHGQSEEWTAAVADYWRMIEPRFLDIEKEMALLNPAVLQPMDAHEWFDWLHDKYFVWKFGTNPARLATTRHGAVRRGRRTWCLQAHYESRPEDLLKIKESILSANHRDVAEAIKTAQRIGGLGVAGASGLIALLFPAHFGTVDTWVVQALRKIDGLPEHEALMRMNDKSLAVNDAVLLIGIMSRKARENTTRFPQVWTPRQIDMVLWAKR